MLLRDGAEPRRRMSPVRLQSVQGVHSALSAADRRAALRKLSRTVREAESRAITGGIICGRPIQETQSDDTFRDQRVVARSPQRTRRADRQ